MEKKYLITGVEPMLYKNFKAACAYYELTINKVLIKHMQSIVDDYLKAVSKVIKPTTYTTKRGKKK